MASDCSPPVKQMSGGCGQGKVKTYKGYLSYWAYRLQKVSLLACWKKNKMIHVGESYLWMASRYTQNTVVSSPTSEKAELNDLSYQVFIQTKALNKKSWLSIDYAAN